MSSYHSSTTKDQMKEEYCHGTRMVRIIVSPWLLDGQDHCIAMVTGWSGSLYHHGYWMIRIIVSPWLLDGQDHCITMVTGWSGSFSLVHLVSFLVFYFNFHLVTASMFSIIIFL